MKITIIGTGYVGLVTGACFAEQGNNVLCLDIDERKVRQLNAGVIPIFEPGLEDMIERNTAAGRLAFTSNIEESVEFGDIQIIAVGTPSDEDGSADLGYVLAAAKNVGRYMKEFKIVIDKSTVPVGTADMVKRTIEEELKKRFNRSSPLSATEQKMPEFSVVSNPEFLKEGAAISDFMRPDRVVVGSDDDESGRRAKVIVKTLYAPFNRNHDKLIYMDVRSAEFTKYAANAMLATRISFMNELANLADVVGADIEMVRQGIGSDSRIGFSFLYAGTGYGGSCFPKDIKSLRRTAEKNGVRLRILEAVEEANDLQKGILVEKVRARFGEDLTGLCFAVWGLAFKPETDDMREAPSRVVISALLERGAKVRVYDPVSIEEAKRCFRTDLSGLDRFSRIVFSSSPMDAVSGADALIVVTEWKAFRSPNFVEMKSLLKQPAIFDGRNLYDPDLMNSLGFEYHGVGRSGKSKVIK